MTFRMTAILAGCLLDGLFGDPHGFPHPVIFIGKLISWLEKRLRPIFPETKRGQLTAGAFLTASVLAVTALSVEILLWAAARIHPFGRLLAESFLCYQMLAARSLYTESMKVYKALKRDDTEGARQAVSMIVGRDTEPLTREGIIKAAVETVAENTSDGVIAPLFYMTLFGIPGIFLYKAVNTMDSMVGYKNDRYLYFGRCAARLDDLANLIPSRISGLFMVLAGFLLGYDGCNAWRIFCRDRYKHKSPNSAQTEAACAGALRIQLAGNAYYFGKLYEKPTIGDALRPVEPEDIPRANRLMYGAAVMMIFLCCTLLWIF